MVYFLLTHSSQPFTMATNLTTTASIEIHADIEQVWDALTDPEMIAKYLYGTQTKTTWEPGTAITFSGEWEGKAYEDKGVIKTFDQYRCLEYTYWSSMSGTEDRPENYSNVSFELAVKNGATIVTVNQDNVKDEAALAHSESNWAQVLATIKQLLEHTGETIG